MTFATGSLVKARGREWIVLPGSSETLVRVRPVGGTDDESTGILPSVEPIEQASFVWPTTDDLGDHASARLLRDALRLGFRSSAGPFRSFGSLAVDPRPYQLLPLLMALRQDPIRLLIADAAGIGKTIEAGLIAAEALANGTAQRLAVLCPPHLADQWQKELASKFHIHAESVLPSTAARLERPCATGQSLFELHPYVIVSTDFIKTDRRREEFLRSCPDLVIVDEAHTCAADDNARSSRHHRYELVKGLTEDPDRHMVLVTGTPDSGKVGTFRSLIGLLDPELAHISDELASESHRRKLAAHFVQRRRADIEHYLGDTPFPTRLDSEASYALHPEYRDLMQRALDYARESVADTTGGSRHQRVRWWSALALLRSLASSPAAAASTLRARAGFSATEDLADIDAIGRHELLDLGDDDDTTSDLVVGADVEDDDATHTGPSRRRLLDMARRAEELTGAKDAKLTKAIKLVEELLDEGHNPIVFCRYIPTAEYVATALRDKLGDRADVECVTGSIPPAEREARIDTLAASARRVLVATDCISEGVNLQDSFDAIVHYDLAWAPTKHEQREARVSRFGQRADTVRIVTYFGLDNQIDGIVLNVLLRKHKEIQKRTGVNIAVPQEGADVAEAIFEGLLLRGRNVQSADQPTLFDMIDAAESRVEELHTAWEDASERERRSRSLYAQHAIKVDEVAAELDAARRAIGGPADVESFTRAVIALQGGTVTAGTAGSVHVNAEPTPASLRDMLPATRFDARFDGAYRDRQETLSRSHPFVEALSTHTLTAALDPIGDRVASRAAVTTTDGVARRTTLLLVRYRFDIITTRQDVESVLLAEDADIVGFEGPASTPRWLTDDELTVVLAARPTGSTPEEKARHFLGSVLDDRAVLDDHLIAQAATRAEELLATHRKVRTEAGMRGTRYRVTPHLPPDVLGVYVLLPGGGA